MVTWCGKEVPAFVCSPTHVYGNYVLRQLQFAQELLVAGVVPQRVEAGVGYEGQSQRQLLCLI